jgi:FkbM family methyltransferase
MNNLAFVTDSLKSFRSNGVNDLHAWRDRIRKDRTQFLGRDVLELAQKPAKAPVVALGMDPAMWPSCHYAQLTENFECIGHVSSAESGIPRVTLRDLPEIYKKRPFLAINCVTYDYQVKLAYDLACKKNGIPCVSFHQAMQLFDVPFAVASQKNYYQTLHQKVLNELESYIEFMQKLDDERSREVYYCFLMNHLTGLDEFLFGSVPNFEQLYFEMTNRARKNVVFADGGALDGRDTGRFFSLYGTNAKFAHVFEPSTENADQTSKNLSKQLRQDQWKMHKSGLAERSGFLTLAGRNDGCHLVESQNSGGEQVPITTIDEVAADSTLIKLEIEGSEKAALMGARKTIEKNRPDLIISMYHLADDFLEIPRLLPELLDSGYRLGLRHHTLSYPHTVMYAIPDSYRE